MKKVVLAFISVLLSYTVILSPVVAQTAAQTRYVTDDFEIMLRTGPGMDNKIIKALPSGTRMSLVILDAGRAHSQVRLNSKSRLKELERKLAELKASPKGIQSKFLGLQESYDRLSKNYQKVVDSRDSAKSELDRIKLASSDSVRLSETNISLENEVRQLILQMDDLRIQNEAMKDQSEKKWFALGAVTILSGLILGYILSRFKGRRRANW